MNKQKKNTEVRSSLRVLLGAVILLALMPVAMKAFADDFEDQEATLAQAEQEYQGTAVGAGKDGLGWKMAELKNTPTDKLLGMVGKNIAALNTLLNRANASLADSDIGAAAQLLTPNERVGQDNMDAISMAAQTVMQVLNGRDDLTADQQKAFQGYKEALAAFGGEIDIARSTLANKKEVAAREAEGAVANTKLDDAQKCLDKANTHYASAAAVYSQGHLEHAWQEAFKAQESLLEATKILVDLNANSVTVDSGAAFALRRAAILRLHLQSRLAEIFSLLGNKDVENGENYLLVAIFEQQLALAADAEKANELRADAEEAIGTLDNDETKLSAHFDTEIALLENCRKSDYIIQHADESKLRKGIDAIRGILEEVRVRKETSVARLIPDLAEHDRKVRIAVKSGQVYLQNGRYAQAREYYEQALVEDPYNLAAIRALAKIDEAMAAAADEKLSTLLKDRMAEVRWKWSEPVTPLMAGSSDSASTQTVRKKDDIQGINKKLDDIVIQNLVIDNETLKDVLTEILPREIKKADPEGIGINIVPMLVPMADAGMPGYTPDGYSSGEGKSGSGAGGAGLSTPPAAMGMSASSMGGTYANPYGGMGGMGGMGGYGMNGGMGGMDAAGMNAGMGGDFGAYGANPVQDAGMATGESLEDKLVNLNLVNITPREVLDYLSWQFGLRIRNAESSVIVAHKMIEMDPMETRFYNIEAGVFDAPRTRKKMSSLSSVVGDDDDDDDDDDDSFGKKSMKGGNKFYNAQSIFKAMGVPMPLGASICYYPKNGRLIVHHTIEQQRVIKRILEEINQTPRQVSIEAKFVEISQDDVNTLGFEWSFEGGGVSYRPGSTGVEQGLVNSHGGVRTGNFMLGLGSQSAGGQIQMGNGLRFAQSALNLTASDSMFNIYTVLGNYAFNTVIHALEQSSNTDILSSPKVTTISGQTAQLKVVTQRYFPTSWSEPEINDQMSDSGKVLSSYKPATPEGLESNDIGVVLDVTPTVAPDSYSIYLDMIPSITDFIGFDHNYDTPMTLASGQTVTLNYSMPMFTKREIKTAVVVYDNETVVMGGLMQERLERFEDKIPLLGHLPVLGRLFTSKGEVSKKTNLLMFVNVRLVKPDGQPLRANEVRGLPDFRH